VAPERPFIPFSARTAAAGLPRSSSVLLRVASNPFIKTPFIPGCCPEDVEMSRLTKFFCRLAISLIVVIMMV